jgi:hypothetical protein
VTGNTVDGHGAVSTTFSGADPGAVACGIGVEVGSTVVIGANAFPGPPGNEHHVRDTQSS